jgi:hypothetical protein
MAKDAGGTADAGGVELASAIGEVRRQIARAVDEGEGSPIAFRAGPIELELEVAYTSATDGSGGVDVWVVSAQAHHERSTTTTHRLRVTLTPVDRRGNDQLIDDVGER